MPGFTRESAKRIANVVRAVERSRDMQVIRRGKFDSASADTLDFSFKCTINGDSVDVAAGYKQIIGTAPVSVPATQFTIGAGGSIYAVWIYTTDAVAGSWASPFWAYGTPPAEDATQRVVVLATVTSTSVTHRHLGDVVVLDIVDRTACV